eukprot:1176868-Prorocentrum_minimum.AAC.1
MSRRAGKLKISQTCRPCCAKPDTFRQLSIRSELGAAPTMLNDARRQLFVIILHLGKDHFAEL